MANPQDIAQELWDLLQAGDRDILRESEVPLVKDLRVSLGLPEIPAADTPISIPARDSGSAVILEPWDELYAVRAGSAVELPVQIDTRKGSLVVDPGDPLARARRSIENIDAMKF